MPPLCWSIIELQLPALHGLWVQVLPAEQLDGLYDNPWTCRALLRALLPLARLYAMRLLLTNGGVPRGAFAKSF